MQIHRLFEIVYILLDKKQITAKELSEHFEVSVRTIYRDIEILSGAGIPVYMSRGKGGGIALLPGFVLDRAVMTEGERAEILSSLKAVDAVSPEEEYTALQKLAGLFGETVPDWFEIDFGTWSDGKREADLFRNIRRAILESRVVRFRYANTKGQVMERVAEPMKLIFRGGAWYLYGYCKGRQDFRYFKLKRIRELDVLNERFQRSCGEAVLRREADKYPGERIKLTLKLRKEAAYRVYDEFEMYRELADGSFLVETEAVKNGWLLRYLLGFGHLAEVIRPEEIRRLLQEELEKTLGQYKN